MRVCVCVECQPNKSNPDNGNIKLIKYAPYIQGFKSGKMVIFVVLHVIVRIKRVTICKNS